MAEAVPRVNASLLQQYTDRIVRMVGKAQVVSDSKVEFDSNGPVTLMLPPNLSMNEHTYYEVTGRVSADGVRVLDSVEVGDSINEKAAEGLVKYCQKFPELFAS